MGNDLLEGGRGNDVYQYALGDGDDIIEDTSGRNDSLVLSELASDDIWFSRNDDNLTIGFAGNDGSITVTDWFDGKQHQIESIVAEDGSFNAAQINQLVDAMAGFEPAVGAGNVVPTTTHEALAPSLIKSWENNWKKVA